MKLHRSCVYADALGAFVPPRASRSSASVPVVAAPKRQRLNSAEVCIVCQTDLESERSVLKLEACGHRYCDGCYWSSYAALDDLEAFRVAKQFPCFLCGCSSQITTLTKVREQSGVSATSLVRRDDLVPAPEMTRKQQWATQRLGGLRSGGLVVRIAFHTDATLALAKPTPNIEDYVFDGFESPGTDEDPEVWATERDLAASRMLRKFGTCTRVC